MLATVAIDCMGGDHGIRVTVPAALNLLSNGTGPVKVILVGNQSEIENQIALASIEINEYIEVVNAPEVVEMEESPAQALRGKRQSSMRLAVDLVKTGVADAAVSAGNTGALMAISRFVLKMLPGIERPAIASLLPTLKGRTCMLDLGANVNCEAQHLLQFGVMGSCLFSAIEQIERPSVGLLNIGEEDIKGNETVKQAADLLKGSGLNYFGNVEGSDIYKGTTDVIVCDGFVGNVALKTSEGLAQMLEMYLREEFNTNPFTRLSGLLSLPVIKRFRKRVDYRRYNGASLLGLKGVVVKSHGSADAFGFGFAIERAVNEVRYNMLSKISERITAINQMAK